MTDLDIFIANQERSGVIISQHYVDHPSEVTETVSGAGSTLAVTTNIRQWLPKVIERYEVRTVLDAPCGDWNWMQHIDLGGIIYTGWDAWSALVQINQTTWPQHVFEYVNLLTVEKVPTVDLILCRDFLIHMPNEAITLLLGKFAASGSHYLVTTHCPNSVNDDDCPLDGGHHDWLGYFDRCVNLEKPPFSLSPRITSVADHLVDCPDNSLWGDKELALFDLMG